MSHTSEKELQNKITECPIKPGQIFTHYRNPNLFYKVTHVAIDEATEAPVIVYKSLYGKQLVWVRMLNVWQAMCDDNGKTVPRFNKVSYFSYVMRPLLRFVRFA